MGWYVGHDDPVTCVSLIGISAIRGPVSVRAKLRLAFAQVHAGTRSITGTGLLVLFDHPVLHPIHAFVGPLAPL